MRKFLLAISLCLLLCTSFAQNDDIKKLVKDGIALHDEGQFDEAIKKYDEALAIDKNDFDANYEKSYSLMAAKRYKECIEICKFLISNFKDNSALKQVYSNYGSVTDDAGDPKEAIKIYNKGLDKFPGYYLLHFNKGLTYQKMEKYDDALESYRECLKNNPVHPSSNYYTGVILKGTNKIPSVLAYLFFVICEPQSERTQTAFTTLQKLFNGNVKKEGNNTTIYISTDMLDQKKSKKENDFSSVEFMFTLMGGLNDAKGMDSIASTPAGKFDFKLQMLINSLNENQKKASGFYWTHYVPFFVAMKEAGMTTTFCNLLYRAGDDETAKVWVEQNQEKIKEFYNWVGNYDWSASK